MFPLDKETAKSLVDAVMKTKYSLLWASRKNNHEVLEGLNFDAQRVYISEWTPQFSLLENTVFRPQHEQRRSVGSAERQLTV